MPRWRSSGALSIDAKSRATVFPPCSASTFVIAAVSVVLPWSMCPIVPTLTCGFLRSNFAFAMAVCPPSRSWLTQLRSLREARPSLPERLGPDALRHRLVVRELHREGRATLRARPEIRGIAEHLSEGRVRGDHLRVAARLLARDAAATSVDVADDFAHVLLRGHDLERHDGLEDDGRRLAHRLLERHRARDLEGDLRGIDLVVRAVDDGRLDVDDGVAGKLVEGPAEPLLVDLRLRLDGDRDDGVGELHALEDDRLALVAERVARGGVAETDGRHDVARVDLLDLLALVGVHLEEAPDAFLLPLHRVVDVGARRPHARIHAEERERADVRVAHDLEGERREGLVVACEALLLVTRVRVDAADGRHVERRRQVRAHRVAQRLDALA